MPKKILGFMFLSLFVCSIFTTQAFAFSSSSVAGDASGFWAALIAHEIAGTMDGDRPPIQVVNPTKYTQVVAVVLYNRDKLIPGPAWEFETVGVYFDCFIFELPPHGAAAIDGDFIDFEGEAGGLYAEIISVFKRSRSVGKILVASKGNNNPRAWPLDYRDFEVPPAAYYPIRSCLCEASSDFWTRYLWRKFGIKCPIF